MTFPQVLRLEGAVIYPIGKERPRPSIDWHGGGLYLRNGKRDPFRPYQMAKSKIPVNMQAGELAELGGEYFFAGPMKAHFGHFFSESIGRLWALDRLPFGIPLVFLADWLAEERPGSTASQFFDLMNIRNKILVIDAPTRFEMIWNATDLFRPIAGEGIHTKLRGWLHSRLTPAKGGNATDLYVSRTGLAAHYGRVLGESFIETGLSGRGYRIFRPEEHSISEQIDAYRSARRIVASESSSVHLMSIFAQKSAKVAVIRRRPVRVKSLDAARGSFLTRDYHMVEAIRRYWRHQDNLTGGDYRGLSEINFNTLWGTLENKGFMNDSKSAPIPTQDEIDREYAAVSDGRNIMFDVKPGVRYF